jgi:phosphoribosyl 1,2-cyclic phosphodiesterase
MRYWSRMNTPIMSAGSLPARGVSTGRSAYARHADGLWPDRANERTTIIDSHEPFSVGDLGIQPFPVPHDAREPVQFVLSDGAARLGVLTDAGHVTSHMVAMLDGCDALVLECNHDAAMLAKGSYPPVLKRRMGGPWGHLDNAAAASLLAQLDMSRLRHVVAAHLSEQNNSPMLARPPCRRHSAARPTGSVSRRSPKASLGATL